MKTSVKLLSTFILLISVIFSVTGYSQDAMSGMNEGQHNYYTFSEVSLADQAELARFSTSQSHPEYGTLPFNAPCSDCIELIEKRTSDTRTFLTVGKNGKEFLSQKGYSPLHYKNDIGQWITYNPKLIKENNHLFRANNQFYDIQINTQEGSIVFENKLEQRAPLKFHKNLSFEILDNSGQVIQTIMANWSNFTAGEEGVKVIDIFPNIDLTILVYRDIIKTNFVVKQDVGAFQIKEVMDADVFNKLNQTNSTPSVLNFTENNELAYQIDEIKIFGANQKRDFVHGNYHIENGAVYYTWNQSEFNQLTYPIIIDPTVTSTGSLPQASILGSGTFANAGAFTAGCIYNLAVPTPANCQITDIAWTFTYSAQNFAVLADGACRYGYAGCVSPAAAGFFWFCNNATAGGTCAGTNVSIFADFASCIPAPACAPFNMNFTMEFFDAWGSGNFSNCDPTYISAASAWTMTITGETVAEPSPPTSSSGTLICEGSATNLTATSSFGVPPYVFSWNNGGGVGNPVSVSPTSNTTYTCTITDACNQTATNTITINVQAAPDAGVSAVTSFCSTDPVTSLLSVLTGTPDATGTWSGPSALTGGSAGNFNPATMTAGIYTYNVPGVAPCLATSSTVTVSINPAPNAGTNGTVSFCTNAATSNLFTQLGGTPTAGGTWSPAMTSGTGVFNPAVDPAGVYTYTVTNSCGSASANVTVTLNPLPNAGTNGTLNICSSDPSTDLFLNLGGTPTAGGSWSPAMASGTGMYNPAVDAAGVYTYTATNGCGNATATVTVSVVAAPNAGTNGTVSFCTNAPTSDLFAQLGGTPNAGGSWSPTMASGTGIFNPAVDPAGVYTYTVTSSCGSVSADVTVTLNPLPVAGTNGTLNICSSDPSTDLFLNLGGTPNAGGSWSPAMASGTGVFNPAVDAAGVYTYTATNGCGNATATVTVTVVSAPNAGTAGAVSFCTGDAPTDLFASLGGTPDLGGTWSPAMASGTGVFNPAVDAAGVYSYTVTASCGNATSDVTVTVNPSPNAGSAGAVSFCTTDPSADLFSSLGGTPSAGGTWSPALASGTGVFNPAVDPAGVYSYTVTNSCGSVSADVTVTINSNPSPGTDGNIAFCASDAYADLFNSLGGTPTLGGSWSPAMASGTGVFNPAVDVAGVYTYSVNACGGGSLTATVTVTLNPAPNAGTDNSTTLCDNDPTVNLFTLVLGTPTTGGTWSPTMASGTGVFNPAVDPAGIYVYTVSNSCGSASSNITVTVNSCAPPAAGFTVLDTLVCLGQCFTFLDTSLFAPTAWDWDFDGAATPDSSDAQNPTICVDSIGTFTISLTASNVNGSSTTTMNLVVAPMPTVTIVQDTTIDMNGTAFLTSSATPAGGDYTWTSPTEEIPCPSCQSNYFTPLLTSEYILNYITIEGCEATDTALVTVLFMDLIDVPNGFSPNSDGNNDLLFVKGEGITSMNFVIHNRYGQQVFQADDQDVGWDGSFNGNPENPGVFVWYLEYTLIDGTSNFKKGNVTLIK